VRAEETFEGPYHVAVKAERRVRAVFTTTLEFPDFAATAWVARMPEPPTFEGQKAVRATVRGSGTTTLAEVFRGTDEGPLRQPLLLARSATLEGAAPTRIVLEAIYDATVNRRALEPGPPDQPVRPLTAAERRQYLAANERFDYKTRSFQRWLDQRDLRRRKGERDLDFAYRALEALTRSHRYVIVPGSEHSTTAVAAQGWSECTGLSLLYSGTLRANGIPARMLVGFMVDADGIPAELLARYGRHPGHARVDFYAEGVGWTPVDPASAIHHKLPEELFGEDRSFMLIVHFDLLEFNGRLTSAGRPSLAAIFGQGSLAQRNADRQINIEDLPLAEGLQTADPRKSPVRSDSAKAKGRSRRR
jgi:hypothetical protein